MPTYDLNTVDGILSALSIDPAWSADRREEAIKLECANYNALVEIADALNCASPSSIARVREVVSAVWALKHKSSEVAALARHDGGLAEELRADLADRNLRIADLERTIEATHKVFDGVGVAWSTGADAGRLPLPKRAEYAVEPGFLADAERKALEARIADLERDLAAKDADRVEATLAEMVKALDDCNAPRHYLDDGGRESAEVPAADRIRILAEIARAERVLREQAERNAAVSRDHLSGVAVALDDAGAPRQAGVVTLSPAVRIRAIPR